MVGSAGPTRSASGLTAEPFELALLAARATRARDERNCFGEAVTGSATLSRSLESGPFERGFSSRSSSLPVDDEHDDISSSPASASSDCPSVELEIPLDTGSSSSPSTDPDAVDVIGLSSSVLMESSASSFVGASNSSEVLAGERVERVKELAAEDDEDEEEEAPASPPKLRPPNFGEGNSFDDPLIRFNTCLGRGLATLLRAEDASSSDVELPDAAVPLGAPPVDDDDDDEVDDDEEEDEEEEAEPRPSFPLKPGPTLLVIEVALDDIPRAGCCCTGGTSAGGAAEEAGGATGLSLSAALLSPSPSFLCVACCAVACRAAAAAAAEGGPLVEAELTDKERADERGEE